LPRDDGDRAAFQLRGGKIESKEPEAGFAAFGIWAVACKAFCRKDWQNIVIEIDRWPGDACAIWRRGFRRRRQAAY